MIRIGVDLGGTKIEALALDERGEELARIRRPTPRSSYPDIVEAVASLVEAVEQKLGARGTVGVGIPGTCSPATGLVKNANTTLLIGHALDRDLSERLGRSVRLANDANCFALSEAVDGAASPSALGVARPSVFGVILGTGCGGGLVSRGEIVVGRDAIAGEWGHNPLPWQTPEDEPIPQCWCGLSGCVETYLSGSGLSRAHRERTGSSLSGADVAAGASRGDPACQLTMDRYHGQLARSLATLINVLNPDAIVLGGGVSNIDSLYARVPELWGKFVFSDVVTTRLLKAKHGDSSGVRGAAWLWPSGASE